MTASSTHSPYRTRPSFGSLLFGSIGLWGGASAVISGTTTIDAALSMTLALVAAGLGVLIIIAFSSLRSNRDHSTSSVPTLSPQSEHSFGSLEEPIQTTQSHATQTPATQIHATQTQARTGTQAGTDGVATLINEPAAPSDGVPSALDASGTFEPNSVQTSSAQPEQSTEDETDSRSAPNPWESDQEWSGDVRW